MVGFEVQRETIDDVSVFKLIGRLLLGQPGETFDRECILVSEGTPNLVLDLTECTLVDASGVGLIARLYLACVERGQKLVVVVTGMIKQLLELAQLDKTLLFADSVGEAFEALATA